MMRYLSPDCGLDAAIFLMLSTWQTASAGGTASVGSVVRTVGCKGVRGIHRGQSRPHVTRLLPLASTLRPDLPMRSMHPVLSSVTAIVEICCKAAGGSLNGAVGQGEDVKIPERPKLNGYDLGQQGMGSKGTGHSFQAFKSRDATASNTRLRVAWLSSVLVQPATRPCSPSAPISRTRRDA